MSIDFTSVPTRPWIGAVSGLPTVICGQNGRAVPIPIDWRIYAPDVGSNLGLTVDLTGVSVVNELDKLISVYIDNLGNPTPVYVYFPDTQFVAPCPAYTAIWIPVVTNGRQCTIYGMGFSYRLIGQTNIQFTNIFVPYSAQQIGPVFAAQATYIGHVTQVFNGNIASSPLSFIFNNVFLGASYFNRVIAFCVSCTNAAGASAVRGEITQLLYDVGFGPIALVPIGLPLSVNGNLSINRFFTLRDDVDTSALTLRVNTTSTLAGAGYATCAIDIWNVENTASEIPFQFAEQQNATGALSINIDTPSNGCMITCGSSSKKVASTTPPIVPIPPSYNGLASIDANYFITGNVNGSIGNITNLTIAAHNNFGQTGLNVVQNYSPLPASGCLRAISFAPG